MATELQLAVNAVDARVEAILASGASIEYRAFFARLTSGRDLDPREVTRWAEAMALSAVEAVDVGEHPRGAFAQPWVRGLAVGMQLIADRQLVAGASAS